MSRTTAILALFLGQILMAGCKSDSQKLQDFAGEFSTGFFKNFPDSAALSGKTVPIGALLDAPSPAFLLKKRAFLENSRAELESISTENFEPKQLRVHYFLSKKTDLLLNRLESDLSLFDAGPILQFYWEKKTGTPESRRADIVFLLKKIPAYYEAAKANFTKRKGGNSHAAIDNGIRAYRLLVDLEKDFPENGDLGRAKLALKDWIAFCN